MDQILSDGWTRRVRDGATIIGLAAAVALVAATAAQAAGVTVDGTYSLGYSATAGAPGDMLFSSTPGDVNVISTPPGYISTSTDLGTQTVTNQSSVTNNPFFLDGAAHTGDGTLQPLTVGTPVSYDFFTAAPVGSTCNGSGLACASNIGINTGGVTITGSGSSSIAYGTITASFAFTLSDGATGSFSDTATYAANYNGTLTCNATPVPNSNGGADCVMWSNSNDPKTINFTDGAVMTVTLNNAVDWSITPTVTFNMSQGPKVPEPASLALFGTAVAGLGMLRRRRKAA